MLVAFLQARVYKSKDVEYVRPNLGILLVDFFNTYIACKLQATDIKPFPVGPEVDSSPIVSKRTDLELMRVTDPLNSDFTTNNVTKNSYNFLFMENLFCILYLVIHQQDELSPLNRVFHTCKVFYQLSQRQK